MLTQWYNKLMPPSGGFKFTDMKKYDYYQEKVLKAADKVTVGATIVCGVVLVLIILGHSIFS